MERVKLEEIVVKQKKKKKRCGLMVFEEDTK
jgi:hypothetical protein